MRIKDGIIGMIEQAKCAPVPVDENSHLYADLRLDSVSFVRLLLRVEEAYEICFAMSEMESCLRVNQLIALTEGKVKGRDAHD